MKYPLEVDATLWKLFKLKALSEGLTMRAKLVQLIERYVRAGEGEDRNGQE